MTKIKIGVTIWQLFFLVSVIVYTMYNSMVLKNDALPVPGSTAQQPEAMYGNIIWNGTDTTAPAVYDGTEWKTVSTIVIYCRCGMYLSQNYTPGGTVICGKCGKGHWSGWIEDDQPEVDPWADCKDFEQNPR